MKLKTSFGYLLFKERQKKSITADSLAKSCGVSRSYITLIENGRRLPGKKVVPKIARALGIKNSLIINWYLEEIREKLQRI